MQRCRRTMEGREREYLEEARKLGAAALAQKRAGNQAGARARVLERRRVVRRLEKLRNGLALVDSQLEAIRSSELDREIMLTLRASTSAMKKAGIGVALQDAEQVMGELDSTIRDTQELNSVLAGPLAGAEEDLELDEELAWLEETPLLDPGAAFVPDRPAPCGLGVQPEGRDAEPVHGLPLPSLDGAGADEGGRMAEEGPRAPASE